MFIIIATVIFIWLCWIWKSGDGLNFVLKSLLFFMSLWGLFESAKWYGIIPQHPAPQAQTRPVTN